MFEMTLAHLWYGAMFPHALSAAIIAFKQLHVNTLNTVHEEISQFDYLTQNRAVGSYMSTWTCYSSCIFSFSEDKFKTDLLFIQNKMSYRSVGHWYFLDG